MTILTTLNKALREQINKISSQNRKKNKRIMKINELENKIEEFNTLKNLENE